MIKFTLRMPKDIALYLQKFKYLYQLRGTKISYNKLINSMILSAPNIRISNKDINKIKHIHTSYNYLIFTKHLAYCSNQLNDIKRQIQPIGANINEMAKVMNTYKETLYSGTFAQFKLALDKYHELINKTLKSLNQIDKELTTLWKM